MNLIIESDHQTIIPRRIHVHPPGRERSCGRLSMGIAFWAVLGALAACVPSETENTSGAMGASQAIETLAGGPQLSPELPVNPTALTTVHHENTVVAAGDGLYLVVWREIVGSENGDILAIRVRASDGAWLDPNPIRVGTGTQSQWQPAVAFDGANFLVVWTDANSLPAIMGARVRASDGAVLDTTPLYISRAPMGPYQLPQFAPAVAFDGTNYLVVWHGNFYANGPVFYGVQGIRVRPSDGTCIESNSFFIATNGDNARVAYTDGTYLVTWHKSQNVEAARVLTTGQVVDMAPISIASTAANERSPAVAARSGEFLVTWIGVDNGLWARRVRASDGVKLGTTDIAVGPAVMAPPEAAFDGMDYRISWQGTRGGVRKALVTRVSSLGTVPPDAELVLAEVPAAAMSLRGGIAAVGSGFFLTTYTSYDTGLQRNRGRMRLVTDRRAEVFPDLPVSPNATADTVHLGTAVAAGDGLYLVVWSESGSHTSSRPDIMGVRVRASDGALLDASPLRIGSRASTVDLDPAVAFDGTHFLVVWQDIGSIPMVSGARVRASDGAVLDPAPILISRTVTGPFPLSQTSPAVASDGTNFLVTWTGGVYENEQVYFGIRGMRVRSSDGTCVESNSFTIARNGASSRVAYADGNYLVAWDGGGMVGATRVSATGQVLDTAPISIAPSSANARTPAVASQSGEFLVTWIGGNGLWARRVRASDGVKLGAADIFVGTAAAAAPEVTFDGSDYRIAWVANRGGVRTVLNTRVSRQGGMAGDAELALAELHPSAAVYRPGIGAMSPGHFLMSYTSYDPQVRWGRARMRLVSQEWVPAPCDSGESSLALNGSAPLTLECGAGLLYSDPGAQALDGCGNPIPVHAFNTGTDDSGPGPAMGAEGSYSVSYAAWDAMGHTVNAIRTVIVDDTTAPTLTLRGAAQMTHTCGSQWVDPGVEARDACYGDVSPQVLRQGYVNGWAPGRYTVTYTLRDPGGNTATPVTRTVDVANCPW